MSDILLELFHAAMDTLPYVPNPELDKAEEALEERLGQEGDGLLRTYAESLNARNWEQLKYVFFMGLSLGVELGTFKPSLDVCRR